MVQSLWLHDPDVIAAASPERWSGWLIGDRFSRQPRHPCDLTSLIAALGVLYPTLREPNRGDDRRTARWSPLIYTFVTARPLRLRARIIPDRISVAWHRRGRRLRPRRLDRRTPYLRGLSIRAASVIRGVLWMVIVMLAALSAAILTLRVETARLSLDDNGPDVSDDDALDVPSPRTITGIINPGGSVPMNIIDKSIHADQQQAISDQSRRLRARPAL